MQDVGDEPEEMTRGEVKPTVKAVEPNQVVPRCMKAPDKIGTCLPKTRDKLRIRVPDFEKIGTCWKAAYARRTDFPSRGE